MVAFNFQSLNGVEPRYGGGSGMAVGKHRVIITKSDTVMTKDQTGGYIALTLQNEAGDTHTDRLNVHNTNPTTVRIANEQLAMYCAVMGLNPATLTDTAQLHGIPFGMEIGPQKNEPKYTEVKGLLMADGSEYKAGAAPAAPAAAPAPAFGAAPAAPAAAPAPAFGAQPAAPAAPAPAFGAAPAAPAFGAPAGGAPGWART